MTARGRTNPADSALATKVLAVTFAVVYLLEVLASGGQFFNMPAQALVAVGGNAPVLTFGAGEYWRLVTAILLHGGLLHVALNTYAFVYIGSALERSLGSGWLVAGFVFSGVVGSVVSAYGNPPGAVAIGASGGIFGLLAMAAALTWLAPRLAAFPRQLLVQWLVIALLIGFAAGFDNWGHLGGIAGGALCALVISALRHQRRALHIAGLVVGALATMVTALAMLLAARSYL